MQNWRLTILNTDNIWTSMLYHGQSDNTKLVKFKKISFEKHAGHKLQSIY